MRISKKIVTIVVAVVLVLLVGGGGYYYYVYTSQLERERLWRQTLVVGLLQRIDILDPGFSVMNDNANVYAQIFDPLLWFDSATAEIKPHLAEKWDVSPDGLHYTFYLRKGVKFHDGTPLNATAVKMSFDRIRELKGPAMGAVTVVDKVEVVDQYTIRFSLTTPFPAFFTYFAGQPRPSLYIVSPTSAKRLGEKFREAPVGTGPYKFVEWVKDDRVVLQANKDYFKGPPEFEKIVFRLLKDPVTAKLALEKGEIDFLYDGLATIPPSDMDSFKANPKLKVRTSASPVYTFLFFWAPSGPTSNKLVRQAIAYAVNREVIIGKILGGWMTMPRGWVPEGIASWRPDIDKYKFNLEKSKELLAKAGYSEGLKLTAGYYAAVGVRRDAFLLMKEDLKKVGIEIDIKSYELGAWLETYKTGANHIQISAWTAGYLDPHGFAIYFLNASIPQPNNGNWVNEEYEKLASAALKIQDQKERAKIYEKMWDILTEELPALPLWISQRRWISHLYLQGVPETDLALHVRVHTLKKSGSPPAGVVALVIGRLAMASHSFDLSSVKRLLDKLS